MLPVLGTGIALAAVPLFVRGSGYVLRIATFLLMLATYAVGFNLLFGHTRQLFLCIGVLAGTGAYGSVLLVRNAGLNPVAAIAVAVAIATGLGAFLSYVGVRRGFGVLFVGIVTLAVSLIFQNLVLGLRKYTNGETGIVTQGLGVGLAENPVQAYYILLAVLVAALAVYQEIMGSRHGLALHALSDDEVSAELSGIDVARYKVGVAALAAGFISLVGALFADWNGFISPSLFSVGHVDIPVLIVLLLGGMRTLLGPVVGAIVFTIVDAIVRPFGQLTVLAYGVLLVALFLVFREGTVTLLQRGWEMVQSSTQRGQVGRGVAADEDGDPLSQRTNSRAKSPY
ncbi:MAG: branched-chain amino acid ABC transporter permease [Armatimonadota bacterium]|nr:branched-chain amino acid ABC transporter permease [Armatimonadota bacterium]